VTAVFEKHGLKIQYPENWQLQENAAEQQALEIQIAAPSGAFWSLLAFSEEVDALDLMSEIIESIHDNYESVESNSATQKIGEFNAIGFDNYFFCLDLLVCNRMRCVELVTHQLLVTYQAENREFDQMEAVFDAITFSMLSNLPESGRLQVG